MSEHHRAAPDLTVAVLAGGASRRMGRDKALIPIEGIPLIERVLAALDGLGAESILIANSDDYAHLGWPVWADVRPGLGALGGIYSALTHAAHPHVLVVACDMPWLQRPLLRHLISLRHTADAIVPQWEDLPEPLHAVYARSCQSAIEEQLAIGNLKVTGFFADVAVRYVPRAEIARFDPDGRSFTNLNTPEDLEKTINNQQSTINN